MARRISEGRRRRFRGCEDHPLFRLSEVVASADRHYSESAGTAVCGETTTDVLSGSSAGLGGARRRCSSCCCSRAGGPSSNADERVAEVVASLNARMDELGRELAAALERAEEEGRRSRILGELAGSIDLDEVLRGRSRPRARSAASTRRSSCSRTRRAASRVVATLGLSVEEAERHAIAGPPDGRARAVDHDVVHVPRARARRPSSESDHPRAAWRCRCRGESGALGYLTVFTRSPEPRLRRGGRPELEALALARRPGDRERAPLPGGAAARRPRRAHRPAQPPLLPRDARARGRPRASLRAEARADRLRPRRLQGDQRPDRPPRRRRGPRRGGGARARRRPHAGHRVPGRRRRVRA